MQKKFGIIHPIPKKFKKNPQTTHKTHNQPKENAKK
jgi:hypothetical protein